MNDYSRTFDITLSGRFTVQSWWDFKHPGEPYWQLTCDQKSVVLKKFNKNILKEVRDLLKNSVREVITTEIRIKQCDKSSTIFTVTVMGPQDIVESIDPSKIS